MSRPDDRLGGRRAAELGMALGAAGFGGVVVLGALQHDTGWGPTGPGAGYFPLRIGLLLIGVAAILALLQLRAAAGRFAEPGALRRVARLLAPTLVFGIAIAPLGTYVPMALFLLWMARVEARAGWPVALALALGTPAAFFLLFETWLGVPLAKGPLEEALGIY
ncbi:tricarboxylate transporter [Falsiroseomonas bella]|uniref:Tricarboxylate transporter n=1 Tax=Falsiroseomonas bella TaxID=2184016 RepID=A0A317FL32_9PROT|nr:tripartite tricarboxylate transporter TctB family protein [Falsiroseomonas bella]PWS38296.1 tricarboxylate transporter [Falsiroseomonas bella]